MDPHTGRYGDLRTMKQLLLDEGRDPSELVEVSGPPESIERISRAVASHKPNRKARRKAQREARKRNRR